MTHDGPRTPDPLPPYSGEDVTCPKCGHHGADTTYLPHGTCTHGRTRYSVGRNTNERLHRECGNCSYAWDEALVDPPAADQTPTEAQL